MEEEPRTSGRRRTLQHSSLNEDKLGPDPDDGSSATGSARGSAAAGNLTERHPNPKKRRLDSETQSTEGLEMHVQKACTPELRELWQRSADTRAKAVTNQVERCGSKHQGSVLTNSESPLMMFISAWFQTKRVIRQENQSKQPSSSGRVTLTAYDC